MDDESIELVGFETLETQYTIGANAKRIRLLRDGAGPMGWYDRIHVDDSFGNRTVFPAHNVSKWTLANQEET